MVPLVVVGTLVLPEAARAAWLAQPLDAGGFRWPDGPPLFRGESPGEFETVGDVIAALGELDGAPNHFGLEHGGVRGFLLPDAVMALHQDLATALRQAARVGGHGEIAFIAFTEQMAFVLHVGDAAEPNEDEDEDQDDDADPSARWMPAQQSFSNEDIARRFMVEMEFVSAWDQDTSLSRAAFLAGQQGLGLLPLDRQPHHRALLEQLRAEPPAALFERMREGGVTGLHDRPLHERYRDPAALADALAHGDAAARAAAIELLALGDAVAAEAVIDRFLDDPSEHVRRHAVRALGRMATDTAFARLLELDAAAMRGFLQIALVHAIEHHRAPGIERALVAALESPRVRPASWQGRSRDDAPEAWQRDVGHAMLVLEAVAIRKLAAAEERVFAIFDRHPVVEVRVAAAGTLARVAGPLAQAQAMPIQCALLGMGKALNQDDDRRAQLLGVDTKDESLGIKRFGDIDLPTLRALVQEGFANPTTNQNDSPAIGDFLGMLEQHPELRVGGYTVPLSRADYRVSVDSITVDIDDVPAERKDAVLELFEMLSRTATNTEPGGGSHGCWWT